MTVVSAPFQPQKFIADNVRAIPRSGIRDFFDIVQGMKDVITLGVGESDFVTPWHIREAAIYAPERGKTRYTSNPGLLNLSDAIANSWPTTFQLQSPPKGQILLPDGFSQPMHI